MVPKMKNRNCFLIGILFLVDFVLEENDLVPKMENNFILGYLLLSPWLVLKW